MMSAPQSRAGTHRPPFVRAAAWVRRAAASPMVLAYAVGPPSLLVLWLLQRERWIAGTSLWVYAAALIGGSVASTVGNLLHIRRPSPLTLHLRVAAGALATTAIVYTTGWGPVIVVVYFFTAQQVVAVTASTTWRIAVAWDLAFITAGQVGIALGVFPSFVPRPMEHGAAVLGAVALVFVSRMAETTAASLAASEEKFRSLVQNSSDMIIVLDEHAAPVYVSGASRRLLGLEADELTRYTLRDIVHPDDLDNVRQLFTGALGQGGSTEPVGLRVQDGSDGSDGGWRHLEAVATDLSHNPAVGGVVLNVRDITERKQAEEELAHQALHDALTHLPNRALLFDRLSNCLARVGRTGAHPAVLFLDVDRFKLVNDTLGHEAGDVVLVEVARRIQAAVRSADTVARFGGDEFVVLCESPDDVEALGERLLSAFAEPFVIDGRDYYLSASIGISQVTDGTASAGDLVRDADTAMYRAKDGGRARVEVFDEAARTRAVERVRTEHLLRTAIDRDELRVEYQPIVELASGATVSVEALLRWDHPEHGLVGPSAFIATAEDSGLIVPIGTWVLRQVCEEAARWAADGRRTGVTVNVSARQLAEEGFVPSVAEILAGCGVDAAAIGLTLEVTESLLFRDPVTAGQRLESLKALGIRIAMDDFGTGYSSLAYLRQYPFDTLKIDRSFVSGVAENSRDRAIVRATIELAHGLDLAVVAEGVERPDQLEILRSLGCDLAQGYLLGRPSAAPAPGRALTPWG